MVSYPTPRIFRHLQGHIPQTEEKESDFALDCRAGAYKFAVCESGDQDELSVEQTEAVKLLNPLAVEDVCLGSARHVLDMASIDHPNFKAVLFQDFVKTYPVDTC